MKIIFEEKSARYYRLWAWVWFVLFTLAFCGRLAPAQAPPSQSESDG
jgi:hypothetical protein